VLLIELGQLREAELALGEVAPATPEQKKWKAYATARLLLLQDQPAPALRMFEDILERHEELPESLHVAATFGATDARLTLRGTEGADDVLEAFIWRNPSSPYLPSVFRRLDQIYAAEENASDAELQKWVQKGPMQRNSLALFYLARLQVRQHKWDKADLSLHRFLSVYPAHPLGVEASLMQAEVDTANGRFPEVVRALEEAMRRTQDAHLRATLELRTGLAHYQQGEFLLSATLFEDAARHSESLRAMATFNAALAWLHVPNFDRFREAYRSFAQQWPESALRGELLLEEGLVQARSQDPRAAESLKAFLRDYPASTRRAEARLALAELGLNSEGDPEAAAAQYLQVSDPVPASPEIAAKSDYLEIFLADSHQPPEDAKVIALALKFLRERPEAPEVQEVRMKLGQVYFRRGDYANAETQLINLTEASPEGPYTESALFLAGESAVKLINTGAVDRALGYFERVIKMDGSLKLYARQEQALVQERLEHEDQAIALYDIILAAEGVDPELWQAALCNKGNCLALLGRRELPAKDSLEKAVAVFTRLAGSPHVTAAWRNQALYKKAKALELLGRKEDSQATFYDVLNAPPTGEREYFWFYKAGFDAARVYEQQEKWKEAIGIYQKMAAARGPRTVEAQSRLRQVRLEHFIWD
jgi:TolA-binding protein